MFPSLLYPRACSRRVETITANPPTSILESVAKLPIDEPRVVPMESAEGQAVIQLHAAISYIHGVNGNGVVLGKGFANREIESSVSRKIRTGILCLRRAIQAVGEARAVVDVR